MSPEKTKGKICPELSLIDPENNGCDSSALRGEIMVLVITAPSGFHQCVALEGRIRNFDEICPDTKFPGLSLRLGKGSKIPT
jgi:hypothetical protein